MSRGKLWSGRAELNCRLYFIRVASLTVERHPDVKDLGRSGGIRTHTVIGFKPILSSSWSYYAPVTWCGWRDSNPHRTCVPQSLKLLPLTSWATSALNGASGGSRTHTVFRPQEPKSCAASNTPHSHYCGGHGRTRTYEAP